MSPDPLPLVDLPGTEWQVWSSAVLRTAGFPASGLDRIATPDAAATADAYLEGRVDEAAFGAAYDKAQEALHRELLDIARDPLFREAVAWQNTGALVALDRLVDGGPDAPNTAKRREREKLVARYWTRYCGKNDSIGFFGPVCWVTIDDQGDEDSPAISGRLGPGLVTDRVVDLEWWALSTFADRLLADGRARRWLPLSRQPHSVVRNRCLHQPGHKPLPLPRSEAALLAAADGRPAATVARAVVDDPTSGIRTVDDALALAAALADRGLARWRLDLPCDLTAEAYLRAWIETLPDDVVRAEVAADFQRLSAARDAVAAAAGDPDAVRETLGRLDTEFTAICGSAARRRHGETYAGRGLCYEDTVRDLDVTISSPLLSAIAEPLAILLGAARWLTAAVADSYESALHELYDELAAEADGPVSLGDLWYLAGGLLYGETERPVDEVMTEFQGRWNDLMGLDDIADGTMAPSRVQRSAAELAGRVTHVFPAEAPGWAAGRLHSPDIQLVAGSMADINRGEFIALLSELHVAWATCLSGFFTRLHPRRGELAATVARDLGPRVLPLYPTSFPRQSARLADILVGDRDVRLGYMPAPHWDYERTVPITAPDVTVVDGRLLAQAPDGRRWSVLDAIGDFLSTLVVDAFKLVGTASHSPRVTIDRLVVARESWTTTIDASGLVVGRSHRERFLAGRRLVQDLGLPDRVFAKVSTELKPFFVDFTSPVSVGALATTLTTARQTTGSEARLTFSELLPTPDQTWVPDSEGRRYHSELRLHVLDPRKARPHR